MDLTIVPPKGILQIDDARIVYRNFAGAPSKFNREGDRNFAIVITEEWIAETLSQEGWNVKIKERVDEPPFMFLPVKLKFNDRGPNIYLKSGARTITLDEESVACLDNIDIVRVDLDVRPYDWEVNGKMGRTAYVQSMHIVQQIDRFAERFAEEEFPEE